MEETKRTMYKFWPIIVKEAEKEANEEPRQWKQREKDSGTYKERIPDSKRTAGSKEDPLVTKSYVDTKISNALSNINLDGSDVGASFELSSEQEKELVELVTQQVLAIITLNTDTKGDELTEEVKEYIDDAILSAMNEIANNIDIGGNNSSDNTDLVIDNSSVYVPVELQNGDILLGDEGTEIILRSGSAVSYVDSQDGIVNVSDGTEYMEGVSIPKNNMLIVPRNDGRGIRATNNSTWLIVKGGYTIK